MTAGSYKDKFIQAVLVTFPFWSLLLLVSPSLIIPPQERFDNYGFVFLGLSVICIFIIIASSIVISFFSDKVYRFILALFKSLFIVFFVVCVFFPVESSLVNGDMKIIKFSWSKALKIYGLYTLCIAFCIYIFLSKNFLSLAFRNLFIIASVTSIGLFCYNQYNHWSLFLAAEKIDKNTYQENSQIGFGSENNIIIIMADMLQGSYVEQFLTKNPNEKNGFEGFTFYSRATSPFPFTSYGVPALLTGDLYANDTKAGALEMFNRVKKDSLINDAISSGYDKNIITIDTMPIHKDQISYGSQTVSANETVLILIELSLKRMFRISVNPLSNIDPDMMLVGYKLEGKKIAERLAREQIGPSRNKIIYFHTLIPHVPILFEAKDINSPERNYSTKKLTVENYHSEVQFFLGQVRDILENMKQLGIYDKSLVIIVADHGHVMSMRPDLNNDKLGSEDFNPSSMGPGDREIGMYNAAILIKPPYKSEPMNISRVAASNTGIRTVVKKYLSQNKNDEELLKAFENRKQSIVVFEPGNNQTNLYNESDNHITYEFDGSIADLNKKLNSERVSIAKEYIIGNKQKPPNDYLSENWIKYPTGSWLCNIPSQMVFKLGNIDESSSYTLVLQLKALTVKKYPKQRVLISVNGKDAGEYVFSGYFKQSVDIPIPAKSLFSNKVNIIEFKPLDAISPTEAEIWKTERPLSIFLKSFQILEKKDASAIAGAKDMVDG